MVQYPQVGGAYYVDATGQNDVDGWHGRRVTVTHREYMPGTEDLYGIRDAEGEEGAVHADALSYSCPCPTPAQAAPHLEQMRAVVAKAHPEATITNFRGHGLEATHGQYRLTLEWNWGIWVLTLQPFPPHNRTVVVRCSSESDAHTQTTLLLSGIAGFGS